MLISVYLSQDAQTIVSLLISCRAHIGNVAGHFRRKYGTKRVPAIGDKDSIIVIKRGAHFPAHLSMRSLFCLSLKLQL